MSSIKFLCPNGHQLNAPARLVGKAGKCPKCGTAFIVPSPEAETPPEPELEESTPPNLEQTESEQPQEAEHRELAAGPAEGSPTDGANESTTDEPPAHPVSKPPADVFYFLCPNGHKLNGPSSLKGKLGQCPHCGERFHIPDDQPPSFLDDEFVSVPEGEDDEFHIPDEEDPFPPEAEVAATPNAAPTFSFNFELPAGEESTEFPSDLPQELVDEPPLEQLIDSLAEIDHDPAMLEPSAIASAVVREAAHPLSQILTKMWETKGELGELELNMEDGETLAPDLYSPALSRRDYGVFALYDGVHYTVLVLPWAKIQRVTVNKVNQLPEGLFSK